MDKAVIGGIKYDITIDESNGIDMTAKVYYKILDGVIYISKTEYEEPIGIGGHTISTVKT